MAYEYTPITVGVRTYPDWWKNLPNPHNGNAEIENLQNMKRCFGFTELFKRSFVINHWCDAHFRVTPNEGYKYRVSNGDLPQEHSRDQYTGAFNEYYHTKLVSPWHFKEKNGIPCAFVAADYHHDAYSFKIVPGITQYRDSSSSNINMMLPKSKQVYDFFIPMGTPMVHIIPMVTDKKFQIRNHLVSHDEFIKIIKRPITFSGFNTFLNLRKKNEEQKPKSKCPFHFS
jgi:hypothetical protein